MDYDAIVIGSGFGGSVAALRKVTMLKVIEGGYKIEMVNPLNGKKSPSLSAPRVVLAAGVLGTLEILFRARDAGV